MFGSVVGVPEALHEEAAHSVPPGPASWSSGKRAALGLRKIVFIRLTQLLRDDTRNNMLECSNSL